MPIKTAILSIIALLFICVPSNAATRGGDGATCTPATANWGSCDREAVPWAASVTNTINVSGGTFTSAYDMSQANTKYVLQGNVTANNTAFVFSNDYIILDLNGYTVTYNETSAGEGVRPKTGVWNLNHLAVINGIIIQGAANSSGTSYGTGNNPISIYSAVSGTNTSASDWYIANTWLKFSGESVTGINISGSAIIEQNTVEDEYGPYGTVAERHSGVAAIGGGDYHIDGGTIRNNTVIDAKHRGIQTGSNTDVYGNHITLNSLATNSYGVFGYQQENCNVYENTIIGRGVHPIGIGYVSTGTNDIQIYRNYIDLQVTMVGTEYGDNMYASGMSFRWGTYNSKVYDNEIHIITDDAYSGNYSDTGNALTLESRGKGFFHSIVDDNSFIIADNFIYFTGDGECVGFTSGGDSTGSDNYFVINNSIESHYYHIELSNSDATTTDYPLFWKNTFTKIGSNENYYTINSYNIGGDRTAVQGRFVDNVYSGGASEASLQLRPEQDRAVSVYFGSVDGGTFKYDTQKHDNNNASSTLQTTTYDPATTLAYAVPDSCAEYHDFCTTEADCTTNWDGYTWVDGVCTQPTYDGQSETPASISRATISRGTSQ